MKISLRQLKILEGWERNSGTRNIIRSLFGDKEYIDLSSVLNVIGKYSHSDGRNRRDEVLVPSEKSDMVIKWPDDINFVECLISDPKSEPVYKSLYNYRITDSVYTTKKSFLEAIDTAVDDYVNDLDFRKICSIPIDGGVQYVDLDYQSEDKLYNVCIPTTGESVTYNTSDECDQGINTYKSLIGESFKAQVLASCGEQIQLALTSDVQIKVWKKYNG
tara:strand:- start:2308 stop:2961 length:654 start_codon:yes stop_codon:yes gene_type:complete